MRLGRLGGCTIPLLLVLGVGACGSGGSSTTGGHSSTVCKAGDPVGQPATKNDVPPCAENGAVTLTYGCYPTSGGPRQGSWYAVQVGGVELYGKPGGRWVKAESPDKLDESAINAIGC